jgi:hypothetical protein
VLLASIGVAPARAAECPVRSAQLRQSFAHPPAEVRPPPLAAQWLYDLVRAFNAEADPTRRATLLGQGWSHAIGGCQEPFTRAFAESAGLAARAKLEHLKQAIPQAVLDCHCQGADVGAVETLMLLALHDQETRDKAAAPRAGAGGDDARPAPAADDTAARRALGSLIRSGGTLYRIAAGQSGRACVPWRFRPGHRTSRGRLVGGGLSYDYEWNEQRLTLSGPAGNKIALGCFLNARVGAAGSEAGAVTVDGEACYLSKNACEAAGRAAAGATPVKHECQW